MKAIFQNPRADKNGIFWDHENKKIFIDGLLNQLYPDEIKKIGSENVANLLVLTTSFPHIKPVRAPIVSALGANCVKEYLPKINDIANQILNSLSDEEKNDSNTEDLAFEFAVTVICNMMTGYQTDRRGYQKLASSLNIISKKLGQILSKKPLTKNEELEFETARTLLHDIIKHNIDTDKPSDFISHMQELGWDEFKITINLFFIYFSAVETTASSINYLLWQLGNNQRYAEKILDIEEGETFLAKLISETLRMHPPAFIEGRQFREDTIMEIHDADGNLLKKNYFLRKQTIACLTQAASYDPNQYENPETFNPYRFETIRTQLQWYPFGAGNHVCPGQYLAHAELKTFITAIVKRFKIETLLPKDTIAQKGYCTLRAEAAHIRLKEREI